MVTILTFETNNFAKTLVQGFKFTPPFLIFLMAFYLNANDWCYPQSHTKYMTAWRNGSASDSRSEGCVFESRRGQFFFLYTIWRLNEISFSTFT